MLGELVGELGPATGVLVLELHAGGADGVALGDALRALGLEGASDRLALGAEGLAPLWLGAVAGAGDDKRPGAVRVAKSDVEGAEAAHREADDVGLCDPQVIEDGDGIGDGAGLRVRGLVAGHIGGRVAAGVVGDAAIAPAEGADLGLPAAIVAGELMDEEQRRPRAGLFVVELHAIVGVREGHADSPSPGMARGMPRTRDMI